MRPAVFATFAILCYLPFTAGCGHDHTGEGGDAHAAESGTEHDHSHDSGHVHSPKMGGTLVVLAEEFAHLEIVVDEDDGEVHVWALDAHAENFVRLAQPEIVLTVEGADGAFEVRLAAVASRLSNETVGDTSRFRGQDDRLIGATTLSGTFGPITSRGQDFASTSFEVGDGSPDFEHHDHDDHSDHDHDNDDHSDHEHDEHDEHDEHTGHDDDKDHE